MNNQLTDIVIRMLNEGNHQAFDILFSAYYSKIKFYINGFVKSIDVAEDLTQDIFIKIWENRQKLTVSVKSFDSYIFTIAYRQIIDYIRSKKLHESFYNDQMHKEPVMVCPEDEYMAEEVKLQIEMIIENMPGRQQTIYRMSRNEGVPNDKIAKQLKISKRTVENQLSLAMKKIREISGLSS